MNVGSVVLWFLVAYFVVTLIGIGHTCFNWLVLKMENDKSKPVKSMYDIVAYAKTVPFHPLYNIVIWPIFAYLVLNIGGTANLWTDALVLGAVWSIATIVIDLFGWVIIRHPWAMTWKEMYVDYQPWIALIYLTIFVSPFIAALFV